MTDAIQNRVEGGKPSKPERTLHTFTVPKRLANGITSVGMVELTPNEELRATKRAGDDTIKLAYELAKQALVQINGEPVSEADSTVDKVWDHDMSSAVRHLVITAYGKVNAPEKEDIADFLNSQTVSAG